ncbi:MAG: acyltransferase family protein, partial [Lachnospiraceae bacterium]|nr:acyltransferase family protein [Lachnospiraceae bacterium]
MMVQSKRIEYIDAIKGFAAICVIIGHVCDGYVQSGLFGNGRFLFVLFKLIYSFHMALFFILSGFLFYNAYVNDDETMK